MGGGGRRVWGVGRAVDVGPRRFGPQGRRVGTECLCLGLGMDKTVALVNFGHSAIKSHR